jgi:hypothetical protein
MTVFVVKALKLREGLAQFLYVVESPHPEQVFFAGAHQTLGAIPLPSGARTKARELTIPQGGDCRLETRDINWRHGHAAESSPDEGLLNSLSYRLQGLEGSTAR